MMVQQGYRGGPAAKCSQLSECKGNTLSELSRGTTLTLDSKELVFMPLTRGLFTYSI